MENTKYIKHGVRTIKNLIQRKIAPTLKNRIVVCKSKKELDKCYRNSEEQVITLNYDIVTFK